MTDDVPLDELPVMDLDEGIAGLTYQDQTAFRIDDVSTHESAKPQTDIGAAMSVPLGDHGVMQVLDESIEAFDETDLELLELLAHNVAVALDRIRT